jgi:hypothetical protein
MLCAWKIVTETNPSIFLRSSEAAIAKHQKSFSSNREAATEARGAKDKGVVYSAPPTQPSSWIAESVTQKQLCETATLDDLSEALLDFGSSRQILIFDTDRSISTQSPRNFPSTLKFDQFYPLACPVVVPATRYSS